MSKDGKKSQQELEQEVWSAIAAFEQILEAMPTDRASLEALAHAYEQVGDLTRAKDYLVRLTEVLLAEQDVPSASELLDKLDAYAEMDTKAAELAALIREKSVAGAKPSAPTGRETPKPGAAGAPAHAAAPRADVRAEFSLADEIAFAWNLMEAGELTSEDYASVVQDLTEMCTGETGQHTISVLHVLESRAVKNLERILAYTAKKCGTPYLAMSSFDLQRDAVLLLPLDYAIRKAVLAFEFVGGHAMVCMLNPFNKKICQEVETITGRKCHFYLTMASELDRGIEKLKELLAEQAAAAAG